MKYDIHTTECHSAIKGMIHISISMNFRSIKWKKPDFKGYILCDYIYMTLWKGKPYRQKKDRGYDGERTRKVQKKNFSVVLKLLNCVKLIIMLIQQYLPNPKQYIGESILLHINYSLIKDVSL